jgi:uncharacterized membrane protein YwaF
MHLLTAPVFGSKHLIGLLAVVVLNVALYVVFQRRVKSEKTFVWILTIMFYVLEFIKIGYLIIRDGEFPMNHIPLHLCSMPLYAYLVWLLAKEGTMLKEAAKATAFGTVLIAGITALVMPVNIIGNLDNWALEADNFLPILSFVFHGLMVFSGWYIVKSGFLQVTKRTTLLAIAFTSALMVVALIVNGLTGSDYMLLNEGKGSPLVFLRDIAPLLYTLTMILLGYALIALTFGVAHLAKQDA